jgi:hypothetical protein
MLAYVINLDRRPDRLAQITAHLATLGLPMTRIPAIDGQLWDGVGWKKQGVAKEHYWRGSAGCYFSHILALETAIAANVFPCVILEDDAVLNEAPVAERGMVYLGGWWVTKGKKTGLYGAHAIMYDTRLDAEMFLATLKTHKNTTDSVANNWRVLGHATVYSKGFIAKQRTDHSDILGENT